MWTVIVNNVWYKEFFSPSYHDLFRNEVPLIKRNSKQSEYKTKFKIEFTMTDIL